MCVISLIYCRDFWWLLLCLYSELFFFSVSLSLVLWGQRVEGWRLMNERWFREPPRTFIWFHRPGWNPSELLSYMGPQFQIHWRVPLHTVEFSLNCEYSDYVSLSFCNKHNHFASYPCTFPFLLKYILSHHKTKRILWNSIISVAESPQRQDTQVEATSPIKSAWTSTKPKKKKDAAYYDRMREKYLDFIKGNKLLTILEALNSVTTMIISLLMTDVKTCKLVGVSREAIEEAFKSLTRPNVIWDILLATKDESKQIAGNILMTKALWLQTEYMGTHRTRISLLWVPMDITETMWEPSSPSSGRSRMSRPMCRLETLRFRWP